MYLQGALQLNITRYGEQISSVHCETELYPSPYNSHGINLNDQKSFTITFDFKVTCSADFYGSDCNTYCVSSNDSHTGYSTCGANGEIVCMPGWSVLSTNCLTREYNQVVVCFHCD